MDETPQAAASDPVFLRFAQLPEAFAVLVNRFGLPEVMLSREISTLVWRTPVGPGENPPEELSKPVVLCRVDDDEGFRECAAAIEGILDELDAAERKVGLIVASSCDKDLEWGLRSDLSRAMQWIERSDLRRLVVPDWDSLGYNPDDDPFEFGREQKGIYADWKKQVLTLADIRRDGVPSGPASG